ncbi:DUF1819 domain-containing protein [Clostridium sp. chh4-2]|uniref:DUF1819 family protein n=1 Tax=Clostridium sp. chh4-2 TaxID=2067550 RepID=UPI000CCE9DC1|nr:DUF1819 family protein [Clostridium sp. chh4-2]PNV62535.1 DUF1819 domain-containing protein [Clostridium sp. chh4-2]
MERKEYSASATKHAFWFMEFRKEVQLLSEGKTYHEIKLMSKDENIFGASSTNRAIQIYNTVTARVKSLDESFIPVFQNGDTSTQKMFALVAAMANDALLFDFVYEVVREKMIIGSNEFADCDFRIFFKNKQQQSEKIAGWTEASIKNLMKSYKSMLFEAGLTDKGKDARKIQKPILEPAMELWLKNNGMELMIPTLTGVR